MTTNPLWREFASLLDPESEVPDDQDGLVLVTPETATGADAGVSAPVALNTGAVQS